MALKSAYELANERIIAPRQQKEQELQLPDFIEIPEFSDKKDVTVDVQEFSDGRSATETKLITGKEEKMSDIKVVEPYTIKGKMLEVIWNGQFLGHLGFDRLNRAMAFGLSNRNVKVKVEIEPYLTHINKATQEQLNSMSRYEVSDKCPKVFGVTVPMKTSHTGRKILYTMIESSEKIHPDYIGKLNMMDELWIASKDGATLLRNNNVHPPIYVMPLGVDIERYKPNCGKMDFGSLRGFTFLSVFRWSYRKGFDILLKAYMEEFSGNEDVSLLMVSRAVECAEDRSTNKISEDFAGIRAGIKKTDDELPHIALYTKPIHEKDMPKVYGSCGAFILVGRGEGFGLPYIEAAACGLPVIASNVTAQRDFLTPTNSYLVEPEGYVEAKINGNLSNMAKLCRFYENQPFPNFGRKAIEQTRAHLRYVYEHQKEAKEKAKILRNLVINNYTWDMAVDRVYNRLAEIEGD